jgi:TorA maturation chaperone TorD
MSDPGFEQAIRAAGGVTELARRIGISQPSVSNWSRIPAERVLAVEAATGVPRAMLRPDLYREQPDTSDGVAAARARDYALLAALLMRAPDAALLRRLTRLEGGGTPLGMAHEALAAAAAATDADTVAREYFDLFIGAGRGALVPYASFYLTGFPHERPLARLRADLAAMGIERAPGQSEPEDHAAVLCEIMAGLVDGAYAALAEHQHQCFDRRLAPWAARLFADLESAKAARFYRPVGTIGRLFIDIETQAFALPE